MNSKIVLLCLLALIGAIGNWAKAAPLISNTLITGDNDGQLLQGWVRVNAVLFHAPCNLISHTEAILTGCGSGGLFRDSALLKGAAKTPVKVQFIDMRQGVVLEYFEMSLDNGNNPIPLPELNKNQNRVGLEVSYE
ncbi:TPA: fimbrial protein [Providencia stuartii]|uniref:fimbrial protein n=1 Tax=Providencia TaxID=586 RepID=UPI000CE67FC7|nr:MULTISPECIES: fimbrial protein [Providencia]AVE41240.1 fimbrial protein [Providencia stuartii]MBN5556650.1 fimbrial protein [Providencia stuartii]MBN5561439.1 fimbrial protein [Providencia stuartii]MBN5602085.1 fimbrial protein [Providencia stuartii]MBN5606131.1 fimbrial protein [Providencia stuartii]